MSETPGQVSESDAEAVQRVFGGSMTVASADGHTFVVGNEREAMVCRAKGGGLIECFPPARPKPSTN